MRGFTYFELNSSAAQFQPVLVEYYTRIYGQRLYEIDIFKQYRLALTEFCFYNFHCFCLFCIAILLALDCQICNLRTILHQFLELFVHFLELLLFVFVCLSVSSTRADITTAVMADRKSTRLNS